MKVKGPKGAMVYTPNMVRRLGMIAGGTGITPMLQIIRAIVRERSKGDRTEVDLIFANVNPDDILLKEDLDTLATQDPKFRVYYVLNNPPEGWNGGVGFVTAEMIKVRYSLCIVVLVMVAHMLRRSICHHPRMTLRSWSVVRHQWSAP